jgi:hypothetical protein
MYQLLLPRLQPICRMTIERHALVSSYHSYPVLESFCFQVSACKLSCSFVVYLIHAYAILELKQAKMLLSLLKPSFNSIAYFTVDVKIIKAISITGRGRL